jgi:hypothetical protein
MVFLSDARIFQDLDINNNTDIFAIEWHTMWESFNDERLAYVLKYYNHVFLSFDFPRNMIRYMIIHQLLHMISRVFQKESWLVCYN